jgi:double-strand break repair protein MRE11
MYSVCRGVVNYEDENINIGLPIFSIHGNHDDPSGFGGKSPMDILATAKLVNYFGTVNDPNDIEVMPVLIQKGIN